MKIEQELFYHSKELVNYIVESMKDIKPDIPVLRSWHDSYVSNHKERVAFDFKIIKENLIARAHVIEIGSIPLMLTAALAQSDFKVTGVDIAPQRYSNSIKYLGIEVLSCDIENEKLPLGDGTADAVILFEIFEHLRVNPIFTMKEVLRVLKPNGVLFLSSPNLRSLNGLKNFLFKNRAYSCSGDIFAEFSKIEKIGHMGHVREYTSTEVTEFLENVGFKLDKLIYRGRYYTTMSQVIVRLVPSLRPFITYVARKPK